MPDSDDTNNMTLDEAKAYLEGIDLIVGMNPDVELKIRGSVRQTYIRKNDDFPIKHVGGIFDIRLDEEVWIAILMMGFVSAEQSLRRIVYAVENFFKLTERQEENYQVVGYALAILQGHGIAAVVNSDLANPGILAVPTSQTWVENGYNFMLENAHLAQQSPEYRIYPKEGQWVVQSLVDKSVSPEIFPDIEQAAQVLLKWCGRKV